MVLRIPARASKHQTCEVFFGKPNRNIGLPPPLSSPTKVCEMLEERKSTLMDSIKPECTPLKHEYDRCFNAWFKDYLEAASSTSTDKSGAWITPSIFGGDKLAQLRTRYDTDCGHIFRKYQACVKAAVAELELGPSIEKARTENPDILK